MKSISDGAWEAWLQQALSVDGPEDPRQRLLLAAYAFRVRASARFPSTAELALMSGLTLHVTKRLFAELGEGGWLAPEERRGISAADDVHRLVARGTPTADAERVTLQ